MENNLNKLIDFVETCKKAGELKNRIDGLVDELSYLDKSIEFAADKEKESELCGKYNLKNLEKLRNELKLNELEREIILFEIDNYDKD